MNVEELISFLKEKVELFEDFTAEQLNELLEQSNIVDFESEETLIAFGQEGRFLGVLLEGRADVSITDDSGERHILGMIEPGNVFGEISLMTGNKTMSDVIAIMQCQALLVPQSFFSAIIVKHPLAIIYLSELIVERLRKYAYEEKVQEVASTTFKRSDDPYGLKLRTEAPAKILVVNCGSSSLKYNLFDTIDESANAMGSIERIGEEGTLHTYNYAKREVKRELPKGNHKDAFKAMIKELTAEETGVLSSTGEISAIGHRVVHGGDKYSSSIVIEDEVIKEIENASELAPLHNPVNLIGIRESMRLFPHAINVAVFDTAFHQRIPPYAYLYGLPYEYYRDKRIRRYGFHGTSHFYVALKAAEFLKRPFNELEMIICHLGNGASICAVDHARSVDTSMGFTPTEGLIMGTRCGDIDPAIMIHLMRSEGLGADELDELINKKSGLLGISGVSNDMREVQEAAAQGNHRAMLAIKTFSYRIRKYIGAYYAAMGGLDVVVFTGGIGRGSAGPRSVACQGLQHMGIEIDEKLNRDVMCVCEPIDITLEGARVRVLVIPTNEERMIARETIKAMKRFKITKIMKSIEPIPIPIRVPPAHVHLSQEHVEALFGSGYKLTFEKKLTQPGQFDCKETVNLIGPKGRLENVKIFGPARRDTQIEIPMPAQFQLGIHPPIRASGDIKNTPGITIEGREATITTRNGVIWPLRHIHMPPEEAIHCGLRNGDIVVARVDNEGKHVFADVLVRVHPNSTIVMYVNSDEALDAKVKTGDIVYIDRIQSRG